jgi:alkylation response protein AidB-like acyl-CoA dehydrogenase
VRKVTIARAGGYEALRIVEAATPAVGDGEVRVDASMPTDTGRRRDAGPADTVALHFDGCRIPLENLVGREGGGYPIALSALGAGRVGIAGLSIGLAEAALAEGLAWCRERRAFGKVLTDFQNTQFVLADSRTELDAARLLAFRAARLLDQGDKAAEESSMAKLFATEACGRIVDRMVQLHGG